MAFTAALQAPHTERIAAALGSALQPGQCVLRAFVAVGRRKIDGRFHPLAKLDPDSLGV